MPKAIVLLDLKGFSGLSERGKTAVFREFLPRARKCIDDNGSAVDANTWGDSILAVFDNTQNAVNFALDLRNAVVNERWSEDELHNLKVRIAIHVADLEQGTDAVRELAQMGQHAFGGGIVVPARIEPIVTPNSICFTSDAKPMIETAIANKKIRGVIVDLGERELVKASGRRHLYKLLPPGQSADDAEREAVNQETLSVDLLRMMSIRGINDYVERFHTFAQQCEDAAELDSVFTKYYKQILLTLRLRIGFSAGEEERLEADVLEINEQTGALKVKYGTKLEHENWLAGMKVRYANRKREKLAKPADNDGVAVYCLWASTNNKRGVAVANNIGDSTDIDYYQETQDSKNVAVGWYLRESVKNMYKHADAKGTPPYKSLLSVVIPCTQEAFPEPKMAPKVRYVGVLNITSTRPHTFSYGDCAWAQTCASLLGSLYESYEAAFGALAAQPRERN